jgi:NAD(P)-dependent dehydrogenase (short-subunit alcohol dehydrogenase family)
MSTIDASGLLRPGLLEGVRVLIAGSALDGGEGIGLAVDTACTELGAQVSRCVAIGGASHEEQEAAVDDAVTAALTEMPGIDMLVVDAAALFARERADAETAGTRGAAAALDTCLQAVWTVTRSVFNAAFLPEQRGGRILFLAPAPDAGEHSAPALAGLENLSRTLSIEWARHGVTAVTIAPGLGRTASEVSAMAAYLASPAGAYFSGCLLDLRGEKASRRSPAVEKPIRLG